jgi:DNA-binding response OmpR family regulator
MWQSSREEGGTTMGKPLALIIEDHQDSAVIFAEVLKGASYEIETIATGDVALQRVAETTPAIVVLDLNLPRVSGTDILKQIRADARLAETRVIVATAYPALSAGLDNQADLVLVKPVSFGQLRDLIVRLGLE